MYSAVRGRHRLLSSAVTANFFLLSWCEKAGLFQRSLRITAERAGAGQTVSGTPGDVEKENVEGRGREGKGKKKGGTRVRGVDDAEAGPGMPSAMAHAKTAENSIVGVPKHGGAYMQYNAFGNLFEVSAKYVPPIHIIGRGAYGVVCSALNTETGEEVAIKKIANAFDNKTDAKRTLREIKLLLHMDHENVIAIRDIIRPPQPNNFNDVYIVYELMDTDLHQIIRSNQPLSEKHCQYFLYQLLRGLKYIHSLNVLHRDLKPNNLFLNGNCDLKIGDFGLARTTSDFDFMTEYVVTRWYRAPELLLNCNCYTAAIDVWSVGCIFMELLNRTPLFPGRDYVHQLKLITELIGSPDDSDLGFLRSDTARRYMNHLQKYQRQPFGRKFPNINPTAVDLIERMLVFDPYKRITVEQALSHPYLESLHDINDEPSGTVPFEFDFEQPQFNEEDIKELIMAEALGFNPIPGQKQEPQVHAAEGMDTLP